MITRPLEGLQSKYPVLIGQFQELFFSKSYQEEQGMRPLTLKTIQEACSLADQKLEGFDKKALEGTSMFITRGEVSPKEEAAASGYRLTLSTGAARYRNGYRLTLKFEEEAWRIKKLEINRSFKDGVSLVHILASVLSKKKDQGTSAQNTRQNITPTEARVRQHFKEKAIPIDAPLPGTHRVGMPVDLCALSFAAFLGLPHWVSFLIEQGANPNEMGLSGKSPLHHCAEASENLKGVLECAKLLIQAGADPCLISDSGKALPDLIHAWSDLELTHFLTQVYAVASEKQELKRALDQQAQTLKNEKDIEALPSGSGEQRVSANEPDSKTSKKSRTL